MRKMRGAELAAKTAAIFDIPGEAASGVPRVTVTGNSRVHVENHRGLLEYSGELIAVNARGMTVKIRGAGMEIEAMSDLELVVTGNILGVEFLS